WPCDGTGRRTVSFSLKQVIVALMIASVIVFGSRRANADVEQSRAILLVVVNEVETEETMVLLLGSEAKPTDVLVPRDVLERARFILPKKNDAFVSIASLAGVSFTVDVARLRLELHADAGAFKPTVLDFRTTAPAGIEHLSNHSLYLNYAPRLE